METLEHLKLTIVVIKYCTPLSGEVLSSEAGMYSRPRATITVQYKMYTSCINVSISMNMRLACSR